LYLRDAQSGRVWPHARGIFTTRPFGPRRNPDLRGASGRRCPLSAPQQTLSPFAARTTPPSTGIKREVDASGGGGVIRSRGARFPHSRITPRVLSLSLSLSLIRPRDYSGYYSANGIPSTSLLFSFEWTPAPPFRISIVTSCMRNTSSVQCTHVRCPRRVVHLHHAHFFSARYAEHDKPACRTPSWPTLRRTGRR